jgi:hypothetical protein
VNPLHSHPPIRTWFRLSALSVLFALLPCITSAAEQVTDQDVIPILLRHCANCHGGEFQEADLDLRTVKSMLKGGESGAAIHSGDPDESPIIKKITADEMPPKKDRGRAGIEKVTEAELDTLRQWITDGAKVAAISSSIDAYASENELPWSFIPPTKPIPPVVKNASRVGNPIDAFLLRKLEEQNLSLSSVTDKLTLLRRASYNLTGLPPAPEEIDQFKNDLNPGAYERLVNRLLDSPRYGERWGRFWLDLAGYADSEGKRNADMVRAYAWRYRDYVIRSFNDDKPYDRFLIEQIAGDELVDYENATEITPAIYDSLVATGFLRMAPDGTTANPVNRVEDRIEVITDEVDILSRGVMGLTMECARCHDHKYDPLTQKDYYSLTAVFKGAYDEYDWMTPQKFSNQWEKMKQRHLPVALPNEQAEWDAKMETYNGRLSSMKDDLEAMEKSKSSEIKSLKKQIKDLEKEQPLQPMIRALWDRGRPTQSFVYLRGDHLLPGERVGPDVPLAFKNANIPFQAPDKSDSGKTGRRLAFAKWLSDRRHPLTARVMVNRIWRHHFGKGIVASLDNFGANGTKPTHPELLDWLASEFMDNGWSIKHMHRLILTSNAYRQSSAISEKHMQADLENKLLSRMPLRRLDAEEVHDATLHIAGKLDHAQYGNPDEVTVRDDGYVTAKTKNGETRRSVYIRQRRREMPTILETFDLPQMAPNCIERPTSTIVTQPLHLLNDETIHNLATAVAERVKNEAGANLNARINLAYTLTLNRPPNDEELAFSTSSMAQMEKFWQDAEATPEKNLLSPSQHALTEFCHTLINSAAFLYID